MTPPKAIGWVTAAEPRLTANTTIRESSGTSDVGENDQKETSDCQDKASQREGVQYCTIDYASDTVRLGWKSEKS